MLTLDPSECCLSRVSEWHHRPWQQPVERSWDRRAGTALNGTGRHRWLCCWEHSCFFGRSWYCAGWVSAGDSPHLRVKNTKLSDRKFKQEQHTRADKAMRVEISRPFQLNSEPCTPVARNFKPSGKHKHAAVPTDSANSKIWNQLMTRIKHSSHGSTRQKSSPSRGC